MAEGERRNASRYSLGITIGVWAGGGERDTGKKKAPNEPGRTRTGKREETSGGGSRKGSGSKRGAREEAKKSVHTPAPA